MPFKGSDSRIIDVVRFWANDVEVSGARKVDFVRYTESRLDGGLKSFNGSYDEQYDRAQLLRSGVNEIIPDVDTISEKYDYLMLWTWHDGGYLRFASRVLQRVKALSSRARALVVCDDQTVSLRHLIGLNPGIDVPRLRRHLLQARPSDLVGSDRSQPGERLRLVKEGPEWGELVRYETQLYGWADMLVGIDSESAAMMQHMTPWRPKATLPYVLPFDRMLPANPAGRHDIIFVGANNPANSNAIDWFIDNILPRMHPAPFLHVVGLVVTPSCDCKNALTGMNTCVSAHLQIKCHGALSTGGLRELLSTVRVAVNPIMETAGVATKSCLALAHGVPVVTTQMDGTFKAGKGRCRPYDVACFVTSLRTVLRSDVHWEEQVQRDQQYIVQQYGKPRFLKSLRNIQRRLDRRPLDVTLDGDFDAKAWSIPAQNWHIANTLSSHPGLRVTIRGRLAQPIACATNLDERPTGFQAHVVIRHAWPPRLSPMPTFGCGPGCRVVLLLPWEYGTLPVGWLRSILHNVDEVWGPSRYNVRAFVSSGIPENRTRVVPCGLDCEAFDSFSAASRSMGERFKFFYTGGLLPRKGVDVLIAAWTRVMCDRDDVELLLHTSYANGYTPAQVAELRQEAGRCSNVNWISKTWMDQTQHLSTLAAAHAYVQPSRAEGFGLPVLEAMVLGIPVIATVGGTAADDYLAGLDTFSVNTVPRTCTHEPLCRQNGRKLCLFLPCDGDGDDCKCKELVGPATWNEPLQAELEAQLLLVGRGGLQMRAGLMNARRRAREFCWPSLVPTYMTAIELAQDAPASRYMRTDTQTKLRYLTTRTAPLTVPVQEDVGHGLASPFELLTSNAVGPHQYYAILQDDGNLVSYHVSGKAVWASSTAPRRCPCSLRMIKCGFELVDADDVVFLELRRECPLNAEAFLALTDSGELFLSYGSSWESHRVFLWHSRKLSTITTEEAKLDQHHRTRNGAGSPEPWLCSSAWFASDVACGGETQPPKIQFAWIEPAPASIYKSMLDLSVVRSADTGLHLDVQQLMAINPEAERVQAGWRTALLMPDGCMVHLEHIMNPGSRANSFIINPEQLLPEDLELVRKGRINVLWCKTRACIGISQRLFPKVPTRMLPLIALTERPTNVGSMQLILHAAGASWMKGTAAVLEAWIRHPEWPLLILTCRYECRTIEVNKHLDELRQLGRLMEKPIDRKTRLAGKYHGENVVFVEYASADMLQYLRDMAGVVMMPSECEGFGHSLQAAQGAGRIVVYTDAPPLNEFFQDGVNGIGLRFTDAFPASSLFYQNALQSRKSISLEAGLAGSICYKTSSQSIEQGMTRLQAMAPQQMESMRYNAHVTWRRRSEEALRTLVTQSASSLCSPHLGDNATLTSPELRAVRTSHDTQQYSPTTQWP